MRQVLRLCENSLSPLPTNRYMLEKSDYPDFEGVAEVDELQTLAARLRSSVKEVVEALAAICKWDPQEGADAADASPDKALFFFCLGGSLLFSTNCLFKSSSPTISGLRITRL